MLGEKDSSKRSRTYRLVNVEIFQTARFSRFRHLPSPQKFVSRLLQDFPPVRLSGPQFFALRVERRGVVGRLVQIDFVGVVVIGLDIEAGNDDLTSVSLGRSLLLLLLMLMLFLLLM